MSWEKKKNKTQNLKKKKKNFFFPKKEILARTGLTPESRLSQGPGGHQSVKRQQTNIFASLPLHRTQGKLPTLQCSEEEVRPCGKFFSGNSCHVFIQINTFKYK